MSRTSSISAIMVLALLMFDMPYDWWPHNHRLASGVYLELILALCKGSQNSPSLADWHSPGLTIWNRPGLKPPWPDKSATAIVWWQQMQAVKGTDIAIKWMWVINQPIDRSNNHSTNQLINQPTNQSTTQVSCLKDLPKESTNSNCKFWECIRQIVSRLLSALACGCSSVSCNAYLVISNAKTLINDNDLMSWPMSRTSSLSVITVFALLIGDMHYEWWPDNHVLASEVY